MRNPFRRKTEEESTPAPETLAPLADAIADAVIVAKDLEIDAARAALAQQRLETKDSRVKLNLVIRSADKVRRAIVAAGEGFEGVLSTGADNLHGND